MSTLANEISRNKCVEKDMNKHPSSLRWTLGSQVRADGVEDGVEVQGGWLVNIPTASDAVSRSKSDL